MYISILQNLFCIFTAIHVLPYCFENDETTNMTINVHVRACHYNIFVIIDPDGSIIITMNVHVRACHINMIVIVAELS